MPGFHFPRREVGHEIASQSFSSCCYISHALAGGSEGLPRQYLMMMQPRSFEIGERGAKLLVSFDANEARQHRTSSEARIALTRARERFVQVQWKSATYVDLEGSALSTGRSSNNGGETKCAHFVPVGPLTE